jgi:hypothetical protein
MDFQNIFNETLHQALEEATIGTNRTRMIADATAFPQLSILLYLGQHLPFEAVGPLFRLVPMELLHGPKTQAQKHTLMKPRISE